MRLATSILAAFLATTSAAPPSADACGGGSPLPFRAPEMFLVARHHYRTFVLLDKRVPALDRAVWSRGEHSYDSAEVAPAAAFAKARELTLVGPDGTKYLEAKQHVLIKGAVETRDAMNALEIPTDRDAPMQIAIAGTYPHVAWTAVDSVPVDEAARAWAKTAISVAKVGETGIDLITAWSNDGAKTIATTFVRRPGQAPVGGFRGYPAGVVTLGTIRYAALVSDGLVTAIAL